MNTVRMTTSPQQKPERSDGLPVVRRNEPRRVVGLESVEADRRRSVREELNASEERFPEGVPEHPPADAHEVAEALSRLGGDVVKVLHPIDERVLQQILAGHVDEQA